MIFAQILMKICRNFADLLENVDIFINFLTSLNFLAKIQNYLILNEFWPNSDVNSSFGSVPRRSNLSTKVPPLLSRERRERVCRDFPGPPVKKQTDHHVHALFKKRKISKLYEQFVR